MCFKSDLYRCVFSPDTLSNRISESYSKFAGHLSSSNVPRTTCSQQSLLCVWRRTSRCTVKTAMTAAQNTVIFICLFHRRVCLVFGQQDDLSPFVHSSYFCIGKLLTRVRTDDYAITTVTHADGSVQSSDVSSQQILSDHLQMTARTVCIKN